jgi:hypothetical protein
VQVLGRCSRRETWLRVGGKMLFHAAVIAALWVDLERPQAAPLPHPSY